MKKIIFIILFIVIVILVVFISILYTLGRFGCFYGDKICTYNYLLEQYNMATVHDYDLAYYEKTKIKYLYMKDYFWDKLSKEENIQNHRFLLLYNTILNSSKTKLYIENCLNQGINGIKLVDCIYYYKDVNINKEEVIQRLEKFNNSENYDIAIASKSAINRLKRKD